MGNGAVSYSAANVLPMPSLRIAQAAAVLDSRIKRDSALAYIGVQCSAFGGDFATIGYACPDDEAEIVEVWLHGVDLSQCLPDSFLDALYPALRRAIADEGVEAQIDDALTVRAAEAA